MQDVLAIDAVLGGDKERYSELVDRYKRMVFGIAWSRLGDRDLAEDVAQETFVKAYQHLGKLRDRSRFSWWLGKIARNLTASYIGRRAQDRSAAKQFLTTNQTFGAVQTDSAIWNALSLLPATHRECLTLYYLEDRKISEAAALAGISEPAMKVRLHRARVALRDGIDSLLEQTLGTLQPSPGFMSSVLLEITKSQSGPRHVTLSPLRRRWFVGKQLLYAVPIALMCVTAAYVISVIARAVGSPTTAVHAPSRPPGVVLGKGFVSRHLFASPSIGTITDLNVDPESLVVTAAGTQGAATIDRTGTTLSSIGYSTLFSDVSLVPLGNTGKFDFLIRGSWLSSSILLDSTGAAVWTAPKGDGVDGSVAGDFSGLGTTQVVVGYNGGTGVSLFNGAQAPVWNSPSENVWHVDAYKNPADGTWRIVHSDAGGRLTVMDVAGNVLSKMSLPFYLDEFTLCRWPAVSSDVNAIASTTAGLQLFTVTGRMILTLPASESTSFDLVRAAPVRLFKSGMTYLAVVGSSQDPSIVTSALWIFDPKGKLVYQEILPEVCKSISVLPGTTSANPERLIIGGTDHIWEY